MRSKSILQGVNVPIAPTSTSETKLTNNITISNVAYPGGVEIKQEPNPYEKTATTREVNDSDNHDKINDYLLHLYETILLSDNKTLISNIVFKDSIVLTQEDLSKVIEIQTGKKCDIRYEDPDISCCGMNSVFMKISSIRIIDEGNSAEHPSGAKAQSADYKIKYNHEYLDLITTYHLNLKYVLIYG